jgi:hypothetical protein
MSILYTKVKLYLEANSKTWDDTKVSLQNDGSGDYIKSWDYDGLAQPTADQIASYETAGDTAETLNGVLNTRRTEYPSIVDQLDKIYHSGIDEWKKVIKKVKDDNPKG